MVDSPLFHYLYVYPMVFCYFFIRLSSLKKVTHPKGALAYLTIHSSSLGIPQGLSQYKKKKLHWLDFAIRIVGILIFFFVLAIG